jgi:hypothetical protein
MSTEAETKDVDMADATTTETVEEVSAEDIVVVVAAATLGRTLGLRCNLIP